MVCKQLSCLLWRLLCKKWQSQDIEELKIWYSWRSLQFLNGSSGLQNNSSKSHKFKAFPWGFLGVSQGVQAANPHLPIQERSWSDSSNIGNCPLFEGSFHIWMCLKMRSPCSNQVVCHFTFERHPYHFFRHRNIYQQNALCTPTAQISASKLLKTCFLLRTTRSFEHQTKVLHSFSKVHMKNPGADPVRYSPTFFFPARPSVAVAL